MRGSFGAIIRLLSLLFLLNAGVGLTPAGGQSNAGVLVVDKSSIVGTIESVDPRNLTITIKTDSGETHSLAVAKKSVLAGVTQGERVLCEMKEGKVKKIVKSSPTPKGNAPAQQPTKGELGG